MDLAALLATALPIRTKRLAFTVLEAQGRHAVVRLEAFEDDGSLRDLKEQRVELLPEGLPEARARVLLDGWLRALPTMLAHVEDVALAMPSDFVFPEAAELDSAEAIVAELTSAGPRLRRWLDDRERDDLLHAVRSRVPQRAAAVSALVQPCFVGLSDDETEAVTGASRLGGLPDLPRGTPWPTSKRGEPLDFLGQVNLADVSDPRLPPRGVLSFFYALLGDEGRVLFFDAPVEPATAPPNLEPLAARALSLSKHWQLPPIESPYWPAVLEVAGYHEGYREAGDAFGELVSTSGLIFDPPRHQLLGYAYPLQSSPNVNVEAETAGLAPEQWGATVEFWRRAAEWQLLFQVDSEDDALLGDAGLVYFLIRPDDLAARRFDQAVAHLQCH